MENELLKNIEDQIKELKKKKKELTGKEDFDSKKFISNGLGLLDTVQWAKWFNGSIKTLIILSIITGIIYGLGYWKGWKKQPVLINSKDFNIKVPCTYTDQIHNIMLSGNRLYFDDSTVTVGQIDRLKPYGFQVMPKMFAGVGLKGIFMGVGLELAHFYQLNLDTFLASDKTINLGVSYDLKFKNDGKEHWFENSCLGVSIGKGLDSTTSAKVYWTTKF